MFIEYMYIVNIKKGINLNHNAYVIHRNNTLHSIKLKNYNPK